MAYEIQISLFLGLVGIAVYSCARLCHIAKSRHRFHLVGKVSAIYCYPVVSGRGNPVEVARCGKDGLGSMGLTNGQFVIVKKTGREFSPTSPKHTIKQYFVEEIRGLVTVSDGHDAVISGPGEAGTSVPIKLYDKDVLIQDKAKRKVVQQIHCGENICAGYDMGEEISRSLNFTLRTRGLRLYNTVWNVLCRTEGRSQYGNYVIATEESVTAINKTLNVVPPLRPSYFRPNLVLKGCVPLEEGQWEELHIGDTVQFKASSSDVRIIGDHADTALLPCRVPGEQLIDVPGLNCFNGLCPSLIAGLNAKVQKEGRIRVGDSVFVRYKP
ncbi:mitochondrial amidoxime reducing component 2 [Aplysia californica]|uniref:Mitochondrial amidoxime reducing component 2 n=1 Tax=Aplysia californica TaxID=6500 RepID=A0ABM0JJ80_APLCA|nr:mitochondrial amidoxime reducing component 2 [Aplysia californica]